MSLTTTDIELFSFSHQNTTVEERDLLAFNDTEVIESLPTLRDRVGGEAGILSTCNRTEFYFFGGNPVRHWSVIAPIICDIRKLPIRQCPEPTSKISLNAARHLFRVASSLESVALGENQILAQVKGAHNLILKSQDKSPVLDRLFQFAVRVGKQVRTDTGLCSGAVSISSASVDLAKKIFGELKQRHILLVGAGETCINAAVHFQAAGVHNFTIVNRSEERGRRVAARFDGTFRPLTQLINACIDADIVVFATGSPHHLIDHTAFKQVMRQRRSRQIFIIDISNPRNVDPNINKLGGAYLFNIDDLKTVVASNLKERARDIPLAEGIIEHTLSEWEQWVQSLRVRPTISSLSRYFHGVRKQELDKILPKLSNQADHALVDELTHQIVKKLLHYPIMHMRQSVESNTLRADELDLIHDIFRLNDQD